MTGLWPRFASSSSRTISKWASSVPSTGAPAGLEIFIGCAGRGNVGQRLRPRQHGAFAGIEQRRLAPHADKVGPLLAQPVAAGVPGVHVHAIGAAVDLRGPQLDQVNQAWLQAGLFDDVLVEGEHRLEGVRGGRCVVYPGLHVVLLSLFAASVWGCADRWNG